MMHLTEDQLYHLAELSAWMEPYGINEEKQMEHLKTCKDCYAEFCIMSALFEATGEGDYIEDFWATEEDIMMEKRMLAVIQVFRHNIGKITMTQISQPEAAYQFVQSFAAATRGGTKRESAILKMEELEDERTFIMFDTKNNELMVQIDITSRESKNLCVKLVFGKQEKIEIPMERKGNILNGMLTDIPEGDFSIQIEEF